MYKYLIMLFVVSKQTLIQLHYIVFKYKTIIITTTTRTIFSSFQPSILHFVILCILLVSSLLY
jgi:hypothetical protein